MDSVAIYRIVEVCVIGRVGIVVIAVAVLSDRGTEAVHVHENDFSKFTGSNKRCQLRKCHSAYFLPRCVQRLDYYNDVRS